MEKRPLLGLVMIVKNEAPTIRATIENVHPFVDHFTICDTGSTDGTQDVVRAAMGDKPGLLFEETFTDFATARNRVLDEEAKSANPALYTIMLSADEILLGGDKLRDFLTAYDGSESAFLVELRTERDASLSPRVLKSGSPWRYEGRVHERPVNRVDRVDPSLRILGVTVEHRATDPERRLKRLIKYDVPALREIAAKSEEPAVRLRALLMLAETYELIASTKDRAAPGGEWLHGMFLAMSLYARRMESGGDAAEVEQAQVHFLNVMESLNLYDDQEMLKRLGAIEHSRMPEVHFMIASHIAKLDAQVGFDRAIASARLCRDALADLTTRPVNREILWKSHLIAAHCARALGKFDDAKKSAIEGVECGGTRALFQEFLL